MNKKAKYLILGVILGIGAPLTWLSIKSIFFPEPNHSLSAQLILELTSSPANISLYLFMGLGTSMVMGFLGFFIGKSADELCDRALELDFLHQEVNAQKELFENRYKILDNNIKNFHHISSRIQKSMEVSQVLLLCAEGLHEILGYERVNIFTVDEARENLRFIISTGAEEDVRGHRIPLDERSGVIYKCFSEKKLFLVDDISRFPEDFHLKPPCSTIKAIRSNNFIICPLVIKGEAVGVFGIDNKYSKRILNDTDVDTVKLFVDQASSAITRINLLKAIDTLTTELERSFSEILSRREEYSSNIITLEGAVSSLSSTTKDIASAAEAVLGSVDETSRSVGEISFAFENVSANLDSLTEATYKSASAMEEISASLKNIEESAVLSHKISMQVKKQADEGHIVVSETADALTEIQKAVDFSHKGIMRLSENSTRIDSIVSVINDITKRTNLLALNASIIAAQAGEYGKSFGVVADEIRNLSLQTGHSTGEITTIIEEILLESRAAAENISHTMLLVQKGVDLGDNTGESLNTIIASANKSMEMTEEIKLATREQTHGIDLVTKSIEDISSMTSRIFAVSKEQALAAKNIANAIINIRSMAHEMVGSTSEQVRGSREIRNSVDGVAMMVHDIFRDLESRKIESASVVSELEVMKSGSR
ncbi:MAG: GAF domain-containing protein [Geobacteraceae bacterium]|nr:GAF domain-containing protein [Geobacteraceae bacterium]